MADNVAVTPGTGETIAADDIGGVKFQRVKLTQGADGSATDISSAAPLESKLTNLERAEDTAHSTGHAGIMPLGVRNDAAATSFSGTDGDYTPIAVTAKGEVFVQATALTPGTGAANLGKAEDAAHTTGDTGVAMLAVRTDAATQRASADGDYTVVQTDSKGDVRTAAGGYQVTSVSSKTRPNDTTAYAAGDVISDSTSSPTNFNFAAAARINQGSGVVTRVTLEDSANQTTKGTLELYLFTTAPAATNDNAALALSDTEIQGCIGVVTFPNQYITNAAAGASGNVFMDSGQIHLPFNCASGDDDLYGMLVARNAYTPVAQEVFRISVHVQQD